MIHAFLWLLKIIGIIMLILLGLLVLAVLLVLFAAVCYQAEGKFFREKAKGNGKNFLAVSYCVSLHCMGR